MCLYPNLIKNRKYTASKKNEKRGYIPQMPDQRVQYVPVGCGKCMECRKKKAREWQVRLMEDVKEYKNGKFVTLTFSDKQLDRLREEVPEQLQGYDIDNWIASKAVHRFLGRWRKEYGKSVRHWLVTELGHKNTERIHLHGIIWADDIKQGDTIIQATERIEKHWQYGWVWKGKKTADSDKLINYVNAQTVNYIVKYINKTDEKHPSYKSQILTSKGIGANYIKTYNAESNKFNGIKTIETYKTATGHKIAMPIYWRNKIYNEQQREKLWLQMLDKEQRYVNGEKISISKNEETYWKVVKHYRKLNTQLGYGSNHLTYDQQEYEKQRRNMKMKERIIKKQEKEYKKR